MKYFHILCFLFAVLSLHSCADSEPEPAGEKMPLVVEGWIEEGEAPIVMVTHAVDMTSDAPSFDDFVEKWGRVTIYDNGQPYILTGRVNNGYTPSLIFTSSRLKGKVGHTYRLTIETESDFVEATVTMAAAPTIANVVPVEQGEGYALMVRLSDIEGVVQFQTRVIGEEGRFYPAFCATLPAADIPYEGFTVTRGVHASYDNEQAENFSQFFSTGQTIMVKACRVPGELLPFWTAYDQAVSLGGNIFLSMPQNCRGNIAGGLGYFSANGISTAAVRI